MIINWSVFNNCIFCLKNSNTECNCNTVPGICKRCYHFWQLRRDHQLETNTRVMQSCVLNVMLLLQNVNCAQKLLLAVKLHKSNWDRLWISFFVSTGQYRRQWKRWEFLIKNFSQFLLVHHRILRAFDEQYFQPQIKSTYKLHIKYFSLTTTTIIHQTYFTIHSHQSQFL